MHPSNLFNNISKVFFDSMERNQIKKVLFRFVLLISIATVFDFAWCTEMNIIIEIIIPAKNAR